MRRHRMTFLSHETFWPCLVLFRFDGHESMLQSICALTTSAYFCPVSILASFTHCTLSLSLSLSHPAVQSRDLLRTVQDLGSESTHTHKKKKAKLLFFEEMLAARAEQGATVNRVLGARVRAMKSSKVFESFKLRGLQMKASLRVSRRGITAQSVTLDAERLALRLRLGEGVAISSR